MPDTCPHCNAAVSKIADYCDSCGGKLTPGRPWYVMALGFFFALMLFLWAVDFPALYRMLERWIEATPAP
jgi:hypothetical protein